jgi:hypothetical protein
VAVAGIGAAAALVAADAAFGLPVPARIALWVGWLGLVLALARRPRAVPWPAGAVVVVATAAAAAVVPGAATHLRRAVMPWHRPHPDPGYRVVVTSGDPVVRRGGPVTLSALVEPLGPDAVLPETAALLLRLPDGRTVRVPMTGDGAGGFHFTRPAVSDDFDYRVEAGTAAGPWHAVRVADPVELADDTAVTVTPPPYAAAAPATRRGLDAIEGLQHSTAAVRLAFTRPAGTAFLLWQPAAGAAADPVRPVVLAADGRSGVATLRLTGDGVLRVVVVNEPWPRRLKSEFAVPVRVRPDGPPRFEAVSGITPRPVTLPPGGRAEIAFTAADDLGVAGAEVEYVRGDGGPPVREPVPLAGAGTPRAEGRLTLDLTGKGDAGQTVRFRVRVADGRQVPDAGLGPQEAVYPPGGWAEVRLSAAAPAADAQEALGLRDHVRERIGVAAKGTEEARAEVAALASSEELAAWPVDHAVRLDVARAGVRKAAGVLQSAADEVALRPDLRPFADMLRAEADRLLGVAADALAEAPPDRRAALTTGASRLAEAGDRLTEFVARNDRLARGWLDRRRLDRLAAGADQPGATDRLRAVIADSPALRRAVAASAARDARRLAAEANALADRVRDLDTAADRLAAEVRRGLLVRLARVQGQTADRAAAVLARAETAARLGRVTLPPAAEFRQAAGLIADGKLVDALVELESLARSLDRAAGVFDALADERADAKVAARQLTAWQEDLHARFIAATKAVPFAGLPDPVKEAFRAEQRAVLLAAGRLPLPATSEVAIPRDAALTQLRQADTRLAGDGVGAGSPMKLAAGALARLADRTPSAAERRGKSRPDLDPLRTEVEGRIAAANEVFRLYDRPPDAGLQRLLARKLVPHPAQQQVVADKLAALDLPGLEARQARAVTAARAAADDLRDGRPHDAAASLAWSLRELDRLRQAADGAPPPDEVADELARLQRGVTALAGQQDVARRLAALNPPEAPALHAEAREAVRRAEAAYRDNLKPEEVRARTAAAADALRRLADRLNARESDRDRVGRLAGNRRRAVEEAKRLQGRPLNADASGEARRELNREAEELWHTRVGALGQPLKRRVVEQYRRLQEKAEPDRDAGGQAALADALDDLATVAAEDPELTAAPGRVVGPPEPDPADLHLPSRRLAGLLRDAARQVRAVRERANAVGGEAANRLRPAKANPLAGVIGRQRKLAAAADNLARSLPGSGGPMAAAWAARSVVGPLEVGRVGPATAAAERAARRLKAVGASAEGPAAGVAAELAARQGEIVAELTGWLDRPDLAAAQQAARQAALAAEAGAFAGRLDALAGDETLGRAATTAAGAVRTAGRLLTEGKPRAEAEQHLRQAADALPDEHPPADPAVLALGDALREAVAGPARGATGRKVAEALKRAAGVIGEELAGGRGVSSP